MTNSLSQTILIDDLKLGMYVLDVQSKNRFFKIKSKGLVKSPQIISQLKKQGVTSLVIKANKTEEITAENKHIKAVDGPPVQEKIIKKVKPNTKSVEEEFHQSCKIYDNSTDCIKQIFDDIQKGQKVNFSAINALATEITESVIRNEFAMAILTRIRNKSTYQWEHAINTGVLICGFSLFLGIKKEVVIDITIGAILHDIGTAKVPNAILDKPEKLSLNEKEVMQKHILWGHSICKDDGVLNKITTDMLINHHERLDGSGYPRGIDASKLSKLARITAIVDVYDAMTGEKSYKQGDQPIIALRYLLAKKDKFDRALVQQFIKFVGVHPVGSLVKLSNDTLAVITQGNRKDPLKPNVIAFYNAKYFRNMTSKPHCLERESITIVSSVRPEDYKINLAKIIRHIIA